MRNKKIIASAAALAAGSFIGPAHAGTITGWDYGNVEVGPAVVGDQGAASVVYDRALPDANAVSYGQIYYAAPEGDTPGLEVLNTPYTTGQGSFDGCLIASSDAVCDGPFQSGKRFKEQLTAVGPIDLVFGVETDTETNLYQVFHRMVNLTGEMLEGFSVELGVGVGSAFSTAAGDGLSFSSTVELGPNDEPVFSQFPFGLFGDDAQPNPNPVFTLDGFFDGDGRSGFEIAQPISEDKIESAGFYGAYDGLFSAWLSREMTPDGLLWDYSGGVSDPLVMAWDNGTEWEVRRWIDDALDGNLGVLTANDVFALDQQDWLTFGYNDLDDLMAALGVPVFVDPIEDLANLNLNYAIEVGASFVGDSFTLRMTPNAVAPVPLPAGAPLLAGGLGLLAMARRRRQK